MKTIIYENEHYVVIDRARCTPRLWVERKVKSGRTAVLAVGNVGADELCREIADALNCARSENARCREQADGEARQLKYWKHVAERLWSILDDIDTASDRFKPFFDEGDNWRVPKRARKYIEYVMGVQKNRHDFATTCGDCRGFGTRYIIGGDEVPCKTCKSVGLLLTKDAVPHKPASLPNPKKFRLKKGNLCE